MCSRFGLPPAFNEGTGTVAALPAGISENPTPKMLIQASPIFQLGMDCPVRHEDCQDHFESFACHLQSSTAVSMQYESASTVVKHPDVKQWVHLQLLLQKALPVRYVVGQGFQCQRKMYLTGSFI